MTMGIGLELRQAVARVLRDRRTTVPAVVTLGTGLAAASIAFTVVSALLLRPLPIEQSDRVVAIVKTDGRRILHHTALSSSQMERIAAHAPLSIQSLSSTATASGTLSTDRGPRAIPIELVTGYYFAALEVRPRLGRLLGPGDDRANSPGAMVISERVWTRDFGGRTDVLGSIVVLAGRPLVLVGVVPDSFRGLHLATLFQVDVWVPRAAAPQLNRYDLMGVFARLAPGVTLHQADDDIQRVGAGIESERPQIGLTLTPMARAYPPGPPVFYVFGGAAVGLSLLILAIAAVNVTNVLVARVTDRAMEIAIRMSLGATPKRIARLLGIEAVGLAAGGGVIGLATCAIIAGLFKTIALPESGGLSPTLRVSLDWRVYAFVLAVTVVVAIVLAVSMARQAERLDRPGGSMSLRDAHPVYPRASRRRLLAFQSAAAVVLLSAAGLAVRGAATGSPSAALEGSRVVIGYVDNRSQGYDHPTARRIRTALQSAVTEQPGVANVALTTGLPLAGHGRLVDVRMDDGVAASTPNVQAKLLTVSRNFFDVVDLPLRGGRLFDDGESGESGREVVINESLARALWPDGAVVGRTIVLQDRMDEPRAYRVSGIAADTAPGSPRPEDRRFAFLPFDPSADTADRVAVLCDGPASVRGLTDALLSAANAVDPNLVLHGLRTVSEQAALSTISMRSAARTLTGMAVLGLTITFVGIYGVVASCVSRRWRDIGIMRALGASNARVAMTVGRESIWAAVLGLLPGLVTALGLAALFRERIAGVHWADPIAFGSAALGVLVATLIAVLAAVRPVTRSNPAAILRQGD